MEIKIRNVNDVAVKKIDELAKAKKMSRNELLKIQIEKFALLDVHGKERNRFEDVLQMTSELLIKTMKMVHEQQEEIQKMKALFLMMMDIDEEEMDELVNEFVKKRDENVRWFQKQNFKKLVMYEINQQLLKS